VITKLTIPPVDSHAQQLDSRHLFARRARLDPAEGFVLARALLKLTQTGPLTAAAPHQNSQHQLYTRALPSMT
jgi:hypothetical protein